MPTGYTAGILDGTTKDFNEFAKLCSRAFIMHLRDEPMDSEYKEFEAGDYHSKAIEEGLTDLKQANSLSDEDLIIQEKNRLIESINHHLKRFEKEAANKVKMDLFLDKARSYVPPTKKHQGIANFMIDQLSKTIDFDCNSNYHIKELKNLEDELLKVNADDIRSKMKIKATQSIAYHTEEYEKEIKNCREHNKWATDFFNSLNN